jgi:glycosyltransferase involved in cell wall biosynthesis
MSVSRHDVAIYSPFSAAYYDGTAPTQGGGAEIQMTFLAHELARRGLRVAHIVFPTAGPAEAEHEGVTVHSRRPYHGGEPGVGLLKETAAVWQALGAVDARAYVVRGSTLNVAVIAEFCRLHRRRMVFSSANDFDLVRDPVSVSRVKHRIYLHGLRSADAVVVQSAQQLDMARVLLRRRQHLEQIPSFAEPAPAQVSDPDTFLWVSRISGHKQPLEFTRLARVLPEARFVMVDGPSPDIDTELLEKLRREAEGLSNFTMTGPLRREEVLAYLEHAVAIVSTSEWEGMPNVFLEAWARSVPALSLAFDPDGLIAERGLGIAAAGSWERFVEGASALWSDAKLRETLGRNGRAYLEERHDPAKVCDRWQEVLERIGALPGPQTSETV